MFGRSSNSYANRRKVKAKADAFACHASESEHPALGKRHWISACAGMTSTLIRPVSLAAFSWREKGAAALIRPSGPPSPGGRRTRPLTSGWR
jgi:hypothetical protein